MEKAHSNPLSHCKESQASWPLSFLKKSFKQAPHPSVHRQKRAGLWICSWSFYCNHNQFRRSSPRSLAIAKPLRSKVFRWCLGLLLQRLAMEGWFMLFCTMGSQKLQPVSATVFPNALSSASPLCEPPWRRHSIPAEMLWLPEPLVLCTAQGMATPPLRALGLVLLTVLKNSLAATKSIYWWQLNHVDFKEADVFPAGYSETGSPLFSVMKIIHTNTHEPDLL